jgi:hypothetical protein
MLVPRSTVVDASCALSARLRGPFPLSVLLVAAIALASLAGCSSERERQPIHGSVTSRQPVMAITFRPAAGGEGPAASADVINNEYRFTTENGPVAGWHEVTFVLAAPVAQTRSAAVQNSAQRSDKIPPMIVSPRQPATLQVEVPASGSLQLDLTVPETTR